MKKTVLALSLLALSTTVFAAPGGKKPSWGGWVDSANSAATSKGSQKRGGTPPTAVIVPAGSATYTGSTVAMVSDSSSGTLVNTVATGAISMDVTFSGTGTSTQTGSITGITALGDLAFTGTGTGSKFSGGVTSTTYADGSGAINGSLSVPVVSGTDITAPLSAKGVWNFAASDTLSANGAFAAVR